MKLYLLIISIILLVIGCFEESELITILGASIFLIAEIISLVLIMYYSRLFGSGKIEIKATTYNNRFQIKIMSFLEAMIFFFGAICFLFIAEKWLRVSSDIIFIGQFGIWILSGVVARLIRNLYLKMGFSVWYILKPIHSS